MKMKRWSKEELKQQILKQLMQTPDKGLTWSELQAQFKAIVTLSKALKELMDEGKITAEADKQDRRKTIYKIVLEKAEPDIKRYRIVKFLESLKDPIYRETATKHENYEITVSGFIEGQPKQKLDKEWKTLDTSAVTFIISNFLQEVRKHEVKISKIAFTVTAEEKQ